MAHYDWTYSATIAPAVTVKKHFYWNITAAIAELGVAVVSRSRAFAVTARQKLSASISMVYGPHDFIVNNDAQDTIDGSSPINVGQPIQSNG